MLVSTIALPPSRSSLRIVMRPQLSNVDKGGVQLVGDNTYLSIR
jgi:hypothetical protein